MIPIKRINLTALYKSVLEVMRAVQSKKFMVLVTCKGKELCFLYPAEYTPAIKKHFINPTVLEINLTEFPRLGSEILSEWMDRGDWIELNFREKPRIIAIPFRHANILGTPVMEDSCPQ